MPRRRLPADGSSSKNTSTSKHKRPTAEYGVPDVYRDMLAEAAASDSPPAQESRVSKRQKLSPGPPVELLEQRALSLNDISSKSTVHDAEQGKISPHVQQMIYDDSETSEISDADFVDVELEPADESEESDGQQGKEALQIDLSLPLATIPDKNIRRRKPASRFERELRLDVH